MALFIFIACIALASADYMVLNDTDDKLQPEKKGEKWTKDVLKNYDLLEDELLHEMDNFMESNPEWLFEGDIMLPPDSRKLFRRTNLWPNAIVPYRRDPTLSAAHLAAINQAIAIWESKTCLVFMDKTDSPSYGGSVLYFTDDFAGCYSYIGRVGYLSQAVNLANGCQYTYIVVHEIGHAIGFTHEQSRSGRDAYVKILYDNIVDSMERNFAQSSTNNFGVGYDYSSIMHYRSDGFSLDRYKYNSILSLDPRYQYLMGRSKNLSFRDIKTAVFAYCAARYAEENGLSGYDFCNEGYINSNGTCNCPPGVSGDNCELGEETLLNMPCGESITEAGTYQTPSYPVRENDKLQRSCVYTIQAPEDQQVSVYFEDFSLGPRLYYGICQKDYAEVRLDGIEYDAEFKCGEELKGQTVQSSGNTIAIVMYTNQVGNYGRGLKFQVAFQDTTVAPPTTTTTTTESSTTVTETSTSTTVPSTTTSVPSTTTSEPTTTTTTERPTTIIPSEGQVVCDTGSSDVTLNANDSIYIVSKNYGISEYTNNFQCIVHVAAADDTNVLKIEIVDIDIEDHFICLYDNLRFKDTQSELTFMVACGKETFTTFLEKSYVSVEFKSDISVVAKGFKIKITAQES